MCQINIPILISSVTIIVSIATFSIAYSQMKIASAKTRLDLYNKRFNIYTITVDYYLATLSGSHEKMKEKSTEFIIVFRESKFLFDSNDGIFSILQNIQKNGIDILAVYHDECKVKKYTEFNDNDIERIQKNTANAKFGFSQNILILEEKMEKYINFKTVSGWKFP